MTGLLDHLATATATLDDVLAHALPALARLLLWGLLAGIAGMAIYRRISPQSRLSEVRGELAAVQRQLAGYDGPLSGLPPLMGRQFRLALRQLGMSLGPAMAAGLPVLLLWPMLALRFDFALPPSGTPIAVRIEPATAAQGLRWMPGRTEPDAEGMAQLPWPADKAAIRLLDAQGRAAAILEAQAQDIITPPSRWDWLVRGPATPLPSAGPITALHVGLEARRFIPGVPSWLGGWETPFLVAVLVSSLACRWRWKLQ